MLAINDDGSFALPHAAAQDFARFLEANGVACVGVGLIRAPKIRTPYDPAKVQTLYLGWAKRQQQKHIHKFIVI
jgi:hypothetical protein